MSSQVFDMWLKEEIPITNGIIYPDGRVELLDVEIFAGKKVVRHNVSTTLQELYGSNDIDCSSIIINCQISSSNGKYEIYGGEGSFGGDGFVAVTSEGGQKLEWIAFFEDSNPFVELQTDEEFVYGVTSLNDKWALNIMNPIDVKIEAIK